MAATDQDSVPGPGLHHVGYVDPNMAGGSAASSRPEASSLSGLRMILCSESRAR